MNYICRLGGIMTVAIIIGVFGILGCCIISLVIKMVVENE